MRLEVVQTGAKHLFDEAVERSDAANHVNVFRSGLQCDGGLHHTLRIKSKPHPREPRPKWRSIRIVETAYKNHGDIREKVRLCSHETQGSRPCSDDYVRLTV